MFVHARFDSSRNVDEKTTREEGHEWRRSLERNGVHFATGLVEDRVFARLNLVKSQEESGVSEEESRREEREGQS